MFALLGTQVADKRHVIFDGVGHDVSTLSRNAVIRETLAWLNKYLGPVRWLDRPPAVPAARKKE